MIFNTEQMINKNKNILTQLKFTHYIRNTENHHKY